VAISQGVVRYARCVSGALRGRCYSRRVSSREYRRIQCVNFEIPGVAARARARAFLAAVRPTSDVLVRGGNRVSGPGKPITYYRILRASPWSHARYRTIESNRDAVVECLQSRALRRDDDESIVSIWRAYDSRKSAAIRQLRSLDLRCRCTPFSHRALDSPQSGIHAWIYLWIRSFLFTSPVRWSIALQAWTHVGFEPGGKSGCNERDRR